MKLNMSALFCRLILGAFFVCASVANARDAKELTTSLNYQTTNRADFTKEFANNTYGSKSFVVLPDYDSYSVIEVMEHTISNLTVSEVKNSQVRVTMTLEPKDKKRFNSRPATFITSAENAELLNKAFHSKSLSLACEFDIAARDTITSLVFNQHTSTTLISH